MAQLKFHHHFILGYWSVEIPELPKGEREVAVEPVRRWEFQKREGWPNLKKTTEFYAYVLLRDELPLAVGQGKTKEEAVNDLLAQLEKLLYSEPDSPPVHQKPNVKY